MHPAVSVIFFTVTSGAGFGAMALIGLGYPLGGNAPVQFLACAAAGSLALAGLVSSTFHLGHPERAWRALSQWRSSWLSREGVLAIAALAVFGLHVLAWLLSGRHVAVLGWTAAFLSLATIFATAMIYAQLKTVPQWNSAWTPPVYMGFGLATGFLLVASAGRPETLLGVPVALVAMVAVLAAWSLKVAWWQAAANATLASRGMTRESATGLGFIGEARLLERPHSGGSYLTREMVYRIGRKHARKLRSIALVLGGLLPLAICALVGILGLANPVLLVALAAMMAGLFVERWLFFAEAKHSVALYYE
ncbi:MAG: DmsC/YnfH family molybdoenzyme membrane anchor subunit [Pseudomonadota bacterium]|nr:DmsC/YnfH family molybdoenzyme membrane anchor subunit [Pseudomonadota bacterium]